MADVMTLPRCVSVIVPTHNYRDLLRACLLSLLEQYWPPEGLQIIVVDDASTDGTGMMVDGMQATYPGRIVYISSRANNGPGATRNMGLARATGDIIGFIDADMTVEKNWVRAAVPYFRDTRVAGVEGKTVVSNPERVTPFTHWTENLEGRTFPTCNIFYRRSVLQDLGGFDQAFYDPRARVHFREDIELAFRVLEKGWEIPFAPDVVAYHPPLPGTWKRPIKLAQRYYFDPLLRKTHPAMFREYVERHKIGPFSVGRPKSYIYWANALAAVLVAASLALAWTLDPGPWTLVWSLVWSLLYLATLGLSVLISCRHNWRNVPWQEYAKALAVYTLVPWVYLGSTLKGRWAFRNVAQWKPGEGSESRAQGSGSRAQGPEVPRDTGGVKSPPLAGEGQGEVQ